jgi:hypothetical protein
MPHPIPEDAIDRLATLRGVTDFDQWKRQLENADERIQAQLAGSVDDAWQACLPSWIEIGRVNDCSRAVRAPHYMPFYANRLGRAFAETFRDDYQFLIDVLGAMPVDSHEYLCAFDLLEMMASEFCCARLPVPEPLFAIALPVPPVVRVETACDERYNDLETIGAFLQRACLIDWGEDDDPRSRPLA